MKFMGRDECETRTRKAPSIACGNRTVTPYNQVSAGIAPLGLAPWDNFFAHR